MVNNTFLYILRLLDGSKRHHVLKRRLKTLGDRHSLILQLPTRYNQTKYLIATTKPFETKASEAILTKIHPNTYKALKNVLSKNNRKKLNKKLALMNTQELIKFNCKDVYF